MSNTLVQNESINKTEEIKDSILEHLCFNLGKSPRIATLHDWYMATAYAARERMMRNFVSYTEKMQNKTLKIVGYLSAEFLMGPHLGNALINLGIENETKKAIEQLGINLNDVLEQEEEPGLGNGGLGRLAACYLDSLATLQVPAVGYGIRYEFGIFDQYIRDGWQVEATDKWLRNGNPWEIVKPELNYTVKLGGHTESYTDDKGKYRVKWIPASEIKGIAYDTPVPGYKNGVTGILRLWKSEAVESFDFHAFDKGDYYGAVHEKVFSENISKVLYPNDVSDEGKRLRLSQQYFFVSCSLQNAFHILHLRGLSIDEFPESMTFQLNDTHPSIAIAEMMRLLIDEHQVGWEKAWDITKKTFAYTNHTLLPEALEKWSLPLFANVLPRLLEIIYEINSRFLLTIRDKYPGDEDRVRRMSIIDERGNKSVRMAHLATIGSHAINGVSALHTKLLKQDVLHDFYELEPDIFFNVTNGVTPRRWIKLYNPRLTSLITTHIGESWVNHLETDLVKLEQYADDPTFQQAWHDVKRQNKTDLAHLIQAIVGTKVNPDSLFDIQVKRIHEYKRQHLNVLYIAHLYNRIKQKRTDGITPRTFIFGGKAAPGYVMAKLIIKLINSVGETINNDPDVNGLIKVVFFPDFNVKNGAHIYKAADLSEQISTAGKEASGTGNMKFAMNGALTIGTFDGANIEIMECVGEENFFLFGLHAAEVAETKSNGYRPYDIYNSDEDLKQAIDMIQSGVFSHGDTGVFQPFVDTLLNYDPFLVLKDFRAYAECQQRVSDAYTNQKEWTKMSILNVARMGKFSSDRSVKDYCENIWKVNHA
ncbi:glycogen/starch/alpha-glucan phosphorylase [Pinibacter aurantiacus]|uniref:Alpha-1,4 glucan phosphorylase n=1 Tax=Pinibacter aurantiacus TaxID=2851599 RepID=A0A9E2S8B8_9BACT|nr:glycogen/starch/alpha-glucan phosphorylase [Pinibacter aurantiacus]MBV4356767.1 glycogen/starch/alpha-glucan phosphorylase [Pinibacter aurantiacus]